MALFGQPSTHSGTPNSFFWHSSHFWMTPLSLWLSAPYGHAMMHEQQPTHLSLSMKTAPSTTLSAPEIQLFTHSGSVQCRQETA